MIDFLTRHPSSSVALVDAERRLTISYGELVDQVTRTAEALRRLLGRGLVVHLSTNTPESVVAYLSCLVARCPLVLVDPTLADRMEPLFEAHQPHAVLHPAAISLTEGREGPPLGEGAYRMRLLTASRPPVLHPDLALLLMTSGSTGSPKLVRLTLGNVVSNATAIAKYLGIQPGERSLQSLPVHYSYGLSVVNSHLAAGGTVVMTGHSFLRPEFWAVFDGTRCASFAGVPYVYETLHRLRFDPARHPTLRTMTQAGGGLRPDLIERFLELARSARVRFFVMYGQTEATARISFVPFERLGEKVGSIGIPIPGGHLSLVEVGQEQQRELVYRGPNVMMGYAGSAPDLALGDELGGVLRTGDLATVDEEGFFRLTGRLKRIAKLFGRRISLDDLERQLERQYAVQVAVTDGDDHLVIHVASMVQGRISHEAIRGSLARQLGVPPASIRMVDVAEIPRTPSGKKDYQVLSW